MRYDAVIVGGSVAGLLCAREVARGGHSVLVLEEDPEIGNPEHCGGMVSADALDKLGVVPDLRTFGRMIEGAEIFAPGGKSITVDARRQRVVEVSRRDLDRQIAKQAHDSGARIRAHSCVTHLDSGGVRTADGSVDAAITVDARGVSSLIRRDRTGVLPCAQYEVHAPWIGERVEVHLDQSKYPGFFAWVIPSSGGAGKVGVAGRAINAAAALDRFLEARGEFSVTRRIFAPVWVGGPLDRFVQDGTVIIGDAAGQAKPTTAGGIYSSGMGGVLAGRAIAKFLDSKDTRDLDRYQAEWNRMFGSEFKRQLYARKLLEALDNRTIDRLFDEITPEAVQEASRMDGFDFHAASIARLLGVRGAVNAARAVLKARIDGLVRSARHAEPK